MRFWCIMRGGGIGVGAAQSKRNNPPPLRQWSVFYNLKQGVRRLLPSRTHCPEGKPEVNAVYSGGHVEREITVVL